MAEVIKALTGLANTGGWGVALLVIFLWFKSNDKKNKQDIESKKLEIEQKQKEQDCLLEVVKGNAEALTKLTGVVDNLVTSQNRFNDTITQWQIQMATHGVGVK